MTLIDRTDQITALAGQTAASAQASANAAMLTNALGVLQEAEEDLVQMSEVLTALRDNEAMAKALSDTRVARQQLAEFAARRPEDGRWQEVVIEHMDETNDLVRSVREAAGTFRHEAITSWQRISDQALRRGGGSVAALEALGGTYKRRAGEAKRARAELVASITRIGTSIPTPEDAASVLEQSDEASRAFDDALSLIPDDRVRDGLTRAMETRGLPLREATTLLNWIKSEGLEDSFSVRLSEDP